MRCPRPIKPNLRPGTTRSATTSSNRNLNSSRCGTYLLHPRGAAFEINAQWPDGGLELITGWAGMMKPAGRRVIFADREVVSTCRQYRSQGKYVQSARCAPGARRCNLQSGVRPPGTTRARHEDNGFLCGAVPGECRVTDTRYALQPVRDAIALDDLGHHRMRSPKPRS